jgi:hypothetical protein
VIGGEDVRPELHAADRHASTEPPIVIGGEGVDRDALCRSSVWTPVDGETFAPTTGSSPDAAR